MKLSAREMFRLFVKGLLAVFAISTIATLICLFVPSYKASGLLLINPGTYITSDASTTAALFARNDQKINHSWRSCATPRSLGVRSIGSALISFSPDLRTGSMHFRA